MSQSFKAHESDADDDPDVAAPLLDESSTAVAAQATEPREDDVRARLLAAAGPVFARQGFDRATIREICGDAGVNIASVGYYFGDKLGLYREVFRTIRSQCQAAYQPRAGGEQPPRQELFELVRQLLSRMLAPDDSGWESQLMMREMDNPTEIFSEMVEESIRPPFDRLVGALAALAPPQTPAHVLEQLALSVAGQIVYYRVGAGVIRQLIPAERLQAHFTLEALARHITGVAIAAAEGGLAVTQAAQLEPAAQTNTTSDTHHSV